jgi:glutamate synthase (NADPH/NADH) large chain
MTGGTVLVLGPTGRNFAAGMSGGVAYVHDPRRTLGRRTNLARVSLDLLDADDEARVGELLVEHVDLTGSTVARRLLQEPSRRLAEMVKVMPKDYRRVLEATRLALESGRSVDDAVMAAANG